MLQFIVGGYVIGWPSFRLVLDWMRSREGFRTLVIIGKLVAWLFIDLDKSKIRGDFVVVRMLLFCAELEFLVALFYTLSLSILRINFFSIKLILSRNTKLFFQVR